MNSRALKVAAACVALVAAVFVGGCSRSVEGQQADGEEQVPGTGFAAVPGLKGGQDVFGPYDPVQNWPRPLAEAFPTTKDGPGRRPRTSSRRVRTA
jgi:hypothetical protein